MNFYLFTKIRLERLSISIKHYTFQDILNRSTLKNMRRCFTFLVPGLYIYVSLNQLECDYENNQSANFVKYCFYIVKMVKMIIVSSH